MLHIIFTFSNYMSYSVVIPSRRDKYQINITLFEINTEFGLHVVYLLLMCAGSGPTAGSRAWFGCHPPGLSVL